MTTIMNETKFQAGSAAADITPPLGTLINGDFFPHRATQIHDPLFVRALVLDNGHQRLAIAVADTCVMPRALMDRIKQRIQAQTGIDSRNVLISCTHTHAGGSAGDIFLTPPDAAYCALLEEKSVEAVTEAWQKLQPAVVAHGAADVPQHVVCRRYFMKEGYVPENPVHGGADAVKTNPFGASEQILQPAAPTDPEMSFLAVKGVGGNWISVLANYSLHYAGDWENGTVTADYFGAFSRHLGDLLQAGAGFQAIMSNGTSGDINIWDFLQPDRYPAAHFAKSNIIGRDLAEAVFHAIPALQWESAPVLAAEYSEVTLKVRKPNPVSLATARQVMEGTDYESLSYDMPSMRRIFAREQVLLAGFPEELACPVQAMRIGRCRIGALPGEFFAQTGLQLKQHTDAYFTIGLANANVGYVPPALEMDRGGYETWRCRNSLLERDAESRIVDRMLQLLQKIS